MDKKVLPFLAIIALGIGFAMVVFALALSQPAAEKEESEDGGGANASKAGYEMPHFFPTVKASF